MVNLVNLILTCEKKKMLLIFRNGVDAEFFDTTSSNLPKILTLLMDEYRDLWDTTWQKLQKYSGKSLPHFIYHKSHLDYAEFHMSTTWDIVQSVRLLVRSIEYNNYTLTNTGQKLFSRLYILDEWGEHTPCPAISVPLNGAAEVKCSSPTSRKSQQNRSAFQRGVKKYTRTSADSILLHWTRFKRYDCWFRR